MICSDNSWQLQKYSENKKNYGNVNGSNLPFLEETFAWTGSIKAMTTEFKFQVNEKFKMLLQ